MKSLLLSAILCVTSSQIATAQLPDTSVKSVVYKNDRLYRSLDIPLDHYSFDDPDFNERLLAIKNNQRRATTSKTVSVVLATLGTGLVGAAMVRGFEDDRPRSGNGKIDVQVNLHALPLILAGLGMWGVAVPLFNNGVRHEKQMKRTAVKLRSMMIQ